MSPAGNKRHEDETGFVAQSMIILFLKSRNFKTSQKKSRFVNDKIRDG